MKGTKRLLPEPVCLKQSNTKLINIDDLFLQSSFEPIFTSSVIFRDDLITVSTICEGFGPDGDHLSHCVARLATRMILQDNLIANEPGKSINRVLVQLGDELDHLADLNPEFYKNLKIPDLILSGVSLCMLIRLERSLYIGCIGNCSAYILKKVQFENDGQFVDKDFVVEPLTSNFNLNSLEERRRVFGELGEIRNVEGERKVYVKGRDFPGVQVSRCLGCKLGKMLDIISEPEVMSYRVGSKFIEVAVIICNLEFEKYLEMPEVLTILGNGTSNPAECKERVCTKIKNGFVHGRGMPGDLIGNIIYL